MKLIIHQGLGDAIICNAIIRNFCKKYDKVELIIQKSNSESIIFMLRDLINISYIIHEDYGVTLQYMKNNKDLFKVGFENMIFTCMFDKAFYAIVGLKFEKRWDDFYVERDLNREMNLFKKLSLKENDYIFVHHKPEQNFNIDISNMKNVIVPTPLTNNIFDWIYTFEYAKEIHCIDSSFKSLIDSFDLGNKPLYFHVSKRNSKDYTNSKNNWTII
jgi:hypothetical protein